MKGPYVKRSTAARRHRSAMPIAVLSLGSLALAGCGAANEPPAGATSSSAPSGSATSSSSMSSTSSAPALAGDLNAAGASSITAAMEAWVAGFQTTNPDANITYDPAGSGAGREQFISGAVPLAGSDAYLKTEEVTAAAARCTGGNAVDVPVYVSPIAVVYNLAGVEELKLSAPTIAKIFDQKIKDWSDAAITADNGGTALPAGPITVVNRGDKSGTTENFTQYLSAAAPAEWTYKASGDWPVPGGEAAQGTSGVIQAVTAGAGYIGYADESQAGSLGKVSVKVGDAFVAPSAEGAAAVVDASPAAAGRPTGDVAIDIDRTSTAAGAYPVVLVSYMVACTKYPDAAQGELVKGFLNYVVSKEGQDAAAKNAGSAPISDTVRTQVQTTIDSIS